MCKIYLSRESSYVVVVKGCSLLHNLFSFVTELYPAHLTNYGAAPSSHRSVDRTLVLLPARQRLSVWRRRWPSNRSLYRSRGNWRLCSSGMDIT